MILKNSLGPNVIRAEILFKDNFSLYSGLLKKTYHVSNLFILYLLYEGALRFLMVTGTFYLASIPVLFPLCPVFLIILLVLC